MEKINEVKIEGDGEKEIKNDDTCCCGEAIKLSVTQCLNMYK